MSTPNSRDSLKHILMEGHQEELETYLKNHKQKNEDLEWIKWQLVKHSKSLGDHANCMQSVLRYDNSLCFQDSLGKTLLMTACEKGDSQMVQVLVNASKGLVNIVDKQRRNALFYSIENSANAENPDIVLMLIDKQIAVNQKNIHHQIPLYLAVKANLTQTAEVLLNNHADANYVFYQENLLNIAIHNNNIDIIKLLINHQCDLNYFSQKNHMTCLQILKTKTYFQQLLECIQNQKVQPYYPAYYHSGVPIDQKKKKNVLKIAHAHKKHKNNAGPNGKEDSLSNNYYINRSENPPDTPTKTYRKESNTYQYPPSFNYPPNGQYPNKSYKGKKQAAHFDKKKQKDYQQQGRYGGTMQMHSLLNSEQNSEYGYDQSMRYYANASQYNESYPYPPLYNESFTVSNGDLSLAKGLVPPIDADPSDSSNVVEINLDTQEKQKLIRQEAEIEDKKRILAEMHNECMLKMGVKTERENQIMQLQVKCEQLKQEIKREAELKKELESTLEKERAQRQERNRQERAKQKGQGCSSQCEQSFSDILNGKYEGPLSKSKLANEEIVGRLHLEIEDFQSQVETYSSKNRELFNQLISNLKNSIGKILEEVEVNIFGSFATDLCLPWSDIDVVISVTGSYQSSAQILLEIEKEFARQEWIYDQKNICNATIPVLKITCTEQFMNKKVDITVQESKHNGLECVQLVKELLDHYAPLKPLVLVLKQFLFTCNLNDTFKGGLSSYGLILMIVAYLQSKEHASPSLDHNVGSPNLGVLLVEFLYWYGIEMEYINKGISIHIPSKEGRSPQWVLNYFEYMGDQPALKLFVKDPLNHYNNVARSTFKIIEIKQTMQIAYYVLTMFYTCRPGLPPDEPLPSLVCCLLKRMFLLPYKLMERQNLIQ